VESDFNLEFNYLSKLSTKWRNYLNKLLFSPIALLRKLSQDIYHKNVRIRQERQCEIQEKTKSKGKIPAKKQV
jgi:hypothetical protein